MDVSGPLCWRGGGPNQQDRFDYLPHRNALTHQENARAIPPRPQSIEEMHWHRACVVRNENTALTRRELEHIGIALTFDASLIRGEEIEHGLPALHAGHDGSIQVGIRKKTDAHGSGLLMACRARSNLAHSSGSAWASGIDDSSMARSLASR
jgi:hypothetical protein